MKGYKEVIRDRYDLQNDESQDIFWNNIYGICNPVGFRGYRKISEVIYKFINVIRIDSMSNKKFLDIGCGIGVNTRALAEFIGNPLNVYGMDFSKRRCELFSKYSPVIQCEYGDIVEGVPFEHKFYACTIFDVMMHLETQEQLSKAFKNIFNSIEEGGWLLWFEPNAYSHYMETEKSDGTGFSKIEMRTIAENAGFKTIQYHGISRTIPHIGNTIYLAGRVNDNIIDAIDFFGVMFSSGNHCYFFKKG